MPNNLPWTNAEDFHKGFSQGYSFAKFLKGEQEVNAYEKTTIKSYMNIEYGSAASIEQLTMGYGYFGAVIDKIKASGFDVPQDLQTAFDACERDLKTKIRDNRLKEIKALQLQRISHLSREDKLKNIDAEIKRLEELTK